MFKSVFLSITFLSLLHFVCSAQTVDPARQWFMYRGNYASGVLDDANFPKSWNTETGENIVWKTEIPGL